MAKRSRLSRRAKDLLILGEGAAVDYKSEISALSADDLCAFANTKEGGAILLGVAEASRPDGTQIGIPVGCPVDDGSKLIVLNKALSCHPPVPASVHTEEAEGTLFLRVEVEGSDTRPHCTPKGTYLVRTGPRNAALLPPALLAMFLEREAGAFEERFAHAAQVISTSIAETAGAVSQLQKDISHRIEAISNELGWSDMMFGDTGDKIDRVEALVKDLVRRAVDSGSRLRSIAAGTKSADPVKERTILEAKEALKKTLLENSALIKGAKTGDKLEVRTSGAIAEELTPEEIQGLFSELVDELLLPRFSPPPSE